MFSALATASVLALALSCAPVLTARPRATTMSIWMRPGRFIAPPSRSGTIVFMLVGRTRPSEIERQANDRAVNDEIGIDPVRTHAFPRSRGRAPDSRSRARSRRSPGSRNSASLARRGPCLQCRHRPGLGTSTFPPSSARCEGPPLVDEGLVPLSMLHLQRPGGRRSPPRIRGSARRREPLSYLRGDRRHRPARPVDPSPDPASVALPLHLPAPRTGRPGRTPSVRSARGSAGSPRTRASRVRWHRRRCRRNRPLQR